MDRLQEAFITEDKAALANSLSDAEQQISWLRAASRNESICEQFRGHAAATTRYQGIGFRVLLHHPFKRLPVAPTRQVVVLFLDPP